MRVSVEKLFFSFVCQCVCIHVSREVVQLLHEVVSRQDVGVSGEVVLFVSGEVVYEQLAVSTPTEFEDP